MSNIPADIKYSETHEWVKVEGDTVLIGITDHAQELLGDIVFVDLPDGGSEFAKGAELGVIESVKAASDLYMPLAGEVVEANSALTDAPDTVNQSPYEDGWLVRVRVQNTAELDELMTAEAYAAFVNEG